jgi:hypothetical protein
MWKKADGRYEPDQHYADKGAGEENQERSPEAN